jgi:hypothetical protein
MARLAAVKLQRGRYGPAGAGAYGHCQPFSHNETPNANATITIMAQAKSERLSGFILRSPSGWLGNFLFMQGSTDGG